jgi:hypothetical protein
MRSADYAVPELSLTFEIASQFPKNAATRFPALNIQERN